MKRAELEQLLSEVDHDGSGEVRNQGGYMQWYAALERRVKRSVGSNSRLMLHGDCSRE
jgi:hypothetical protein